MTKHAKRFRIVRDDKTTSSLEFAVTCEVFIEHSTRRGSWQTVLVDNLTRQVTTTEKDLKIIKNVAKYELKGKFKNWINNPDDYLQITEIIDNLICTL